MFNYKAVYIIAIFIFLIFIFYSLYFRSREALDITSNICPKPIFASNPDWDIVDTQLINDFLETANLQLNRCELDLDQMQSLISKNGIKITCLMDVDAIDSSDTSKIPLPALTFDSTSPPNYFIQFKMAKGRPGGIGPGGKPGKPGPMGPTGPVGKQGAMGTWINPM